VNNSTTDSPRYPITLARREHSLSRKDIDPNALKVLYRLHRSGFVSCLVGGSVRDLLLGRQPKDFDVATDARPNQIKRIFRNAFLVGRRFRLAHVRFGEMTIEVSTFRRSTTDEQSLEEIETPVQRDNEYGSPEEDAHRRDFTINALFYNIADFTVIDYVGGLADLKLKIVRTIGEPNKRFREDPVRMIRAIRAAGRLHFTIDDDTGKAIVANRERVMECPSSRVLEEVLTLFRHGAAEPSARLLEHYGLMDVLLPRMSAFIHAYDTLPQKHVRPMYEYLAALDNEKVIPRDRLSVELVIATLFYPIVMQKISESEVTQQRMTPEELQKLVEELASVFSNRWIFPKRKLEAVSDILQNQRRFTQQRTRRWRSSSLVSRPFFDESLDLFRIVINAEQLDPALLQPWEQRVASVRKGLPRHPAQRQHRPRRRSRLAPPLE